MLLDDFAQPNHHRASRFLFHQLCVVDLAGRIIQDHQQIVLPAILKPGVLAAIHMQHHPRKGPPWTPGAMAAPPVTFLDQARSL